MDSTSTFVLLVVLASIPGFIAKKKGRSFGGWFLLSLFITPVITTIIVVCLPKLEDDLTTNHHSPVSIPMNNYGMAEDENTDRAFAPLPSNNDETILSNQPDDSTIIVPQPSVRFCRRCGFELIEDSKYCGNCGAII